MVLLLRCFAALILALLAVPSVQAADAVPPLKFCLAGNMIAALGYIARDQGYFRQQELDMAYTETTSGKICQDFLMTGQADVAITSEAPMTYLSFNDHDLCILAQVQSDSENAVFARADHGIHRLDDLKGRLIGYYQGSSSAFYVARLLDRQGWHKSDVHLTPLQPPALSQALSGGVVDAIVVWEPWGSNAMKQLGDKGIRLGDASIYATMGLLTVRKAYVNAHPEAMEKLLRALLQAENYIDKHPEESKKSLAQALKLDPDVMKRNWSDFLFSVKLDHDVVDLLETNARYLLHDDENFTGKSVPNFRKFIQPQYLRNVAPDRVEKGM